MSSFVLKFRARQALKGRWHTALMVALIAMLPSLIMQVAAILTQRSYFAQNPGLTLDALAKDTHGLMQAFLIPGVVSMAVQLAACVLTLGMLNYMLGILRGEDGGVRTVLSRGRYVFKAMGLQVMIALKMVVWLLPLLALVMVPFALMVGQGTQDWQTIPAFVQVIASVFPIALIAVVVWLTLRYAMATMFQADEPEKGVFQCIRESVQMMKGSKGRLLMLQLSFFGWVILQSAAQNLLMELAGAVVGSTVGMTLNMFLQVYMQTTLCAFYLDCRGEFGPVKPLAEELTPSDAENDEN